MADKPKRRTAAQIFALRTPCVFCGERLTKEEKKIHACWEGK